MAALTQDTPLPSQGTNLGFPINGVIKTSEQLYVGGIVDITAGKIENHDPAGVIFGIVVGAAQPGDDPMLYPPANPTLGSIPVGDGTVQVQVETGAFLLGGDGSITSITGLVGAATEPGTTVWAINNNPRNLTSVDPGGGEKPFGKVATWSSAAGYSINVYSYQARLGL